jgi:hypothetical protein
MNLSAFSFALIAVGGWAVRDEGSVALSAINQHWVVRDSFADFARRLREKQIIDSIANRKDMQDLIVTVHVIDSMLRCDHGHREFCK